jgi:hypothetical protein
LREQNAADVETKLTVLVAYAESDFDTSADDRGQTWGVIQQNPRWWPHANGTIAEQVADFLNGVAGPTGGFNKGLRAYPRLADPVADVWRIQNWTGDVPGLVPGAPGWEEDPRTQNYRRRVSAVDTLIANPNYFQEGNF